jgi:hypothetical protein
MRKTREVLRLKWVLGRSHREIHRAIGVGIATMSETATRATAAGLDWSAVERLGDEELELRLYPKAPTGTQRPLPDPVYLHTELRRAGVTLRLLHVEYLEKQPDGYRSRRRAARSAAAVARAAATARPRRAMSNHHARGGGEHDEP